MNKIIIIIIIIKSYSNHVFYKNMYFTSFIIISLPLNTSSFSITICLKIHVNMLLVMRETLSYIA
jgi:hypothetical protein